MESLLAIDNSRDRWRTLRRWNVVLGAVLLSLCAVDAWAAKPGTNASPATFKVSGTGLLENWRLRRMIRLLELENKRPLFFTPDFIEDSAMILEGRLREQGYLNPSITIEITWLDGRRLEYVWDAMGEPLPRSERARSVRFRIQRGALYNYGRIDFSGLEAIDKKQALSFFVETSGLVRLKRNRIYSPQRLRRSLSNLTATLQRYGFRDASVTADHLDRDDATGNIDLVVKVEQGPRYLVNSTRQTAFIETNPVPVVSRTNFVLRPYSKLWEEDFVHSIKTNYYRQGYPETSVDVKIENEVPAGHWVFLSLLATVKTGPRVTVNDVHIEGNMRTRESLMKARVTVKPGTSLDRVQAEEGRFRLSRLGVFDAVDLRYTPVTSNSWDVTYHVQEGKHIEISPLFGFGSYDILRGGVEIDQYNLWGLAHNQRLRLIQSFKSSSGDYTYTIPEFLGKNADFFVTGSGLRREEISFLRVEYGGGFGVRRVFRDVSTDVTARYNYGILQATETSADFAQEGAQNPTVGAVILDVRHDRRDNPLYPHKGYLLLANTELATRYIGGDVNYARLELSASGHLPLNDSQWLHLNLRHGLVATGGPTTNNLPFTRRFFPGGENSVRGFQQGEAAPRNDQGKVVGAETYTSGTVEFEQAITPQWSVVGFVDGVEFAESMDHYPGDDALFSAGGGIGWKTIVGPIRLEYGYNLNPRRHDPVGTLQFSLGFPF